MAGLPPWKTHRPSAKPTLRTSPQKPPRNWLNRDSRWRERIDTVARNALAPSTQAGYRSAWNLFVKFCDEHGIDDSLRFPADELVLCAFAASHAGLKAGGTVLNRISGLKAWHALHNLQWQGSARLSYVVKGVTNMEPTSAVKPPRPPISAEMLRKLHDKLDLDIPLHAAVFAVATVAFWGNVVLASFQHPQPLTHKTPRFRLYHCWNGTAKRTALVFSIYRAPKQTEETVRMWS
ncbi:hypothetical protein RhiLY_02527 [Ceratobasidium sp. AG-Ba]|nr:hypothetical protein RhiLY_02527 [Ceratobasidium sp. AG-Ba]